MDTSSDFGYKFYSDVSVVQPRSIDMDEQYNVYIPDPVNSVVKKIDMKTGNISSSIVINDSLKLIFDLIFFQGNIVITTTGGYLVLLDTDLNILAIKKMAKDRGIFWRIEEDFFTVYYPTENFLSYVINKDFSTKDTIHEHIDFRDKNRNRDFFIKDGGTIISTNYGNIKLNKPYERLKYGGINVCFSKKFFCFFSIKNERLNVYLQKAKWD